ncbi:MAG: hypothetical protein AAF530_01170 [Pseudomonadota bacterium]
MSSRSVLWLSAKTLLVLSLLSCLYFAALVLSHYFVDDQDIFDSIARDFADSGIVFMDDRVRVKSAIMGEELRYPMADCRFLTMGLTHRGSDWSDAVLEAAGNHSSKKCPKEVVEFFSGDTPPEEEHTYARYWHGYTFLTRPLLAHFSYSGLRTFMMFATGLLFLGFLWTLYRAQGVWFAVAFAVPVAAFSVDYFFTIISYSFMFFVGLAAFLVSLPVLRRAESNAPVYLMFAIVGSLTSFLDRIIDPLFTLCLPLVAVIAIYLPRHDRFQSHVAGFWLITLSSVWWLFGYAYNWLFKIALNFVLFGETEVLRALRKAKRRSSTDTNNGAIDRLDGLWVNINQIKIVFFVSLIVFLAALLVSRLRVNAQQFCLMIVAIMPIAWIFLLANHSFNHKHFVHYMLYITVSCLLSVAFSLILARLAEHRLQKA